MPDEGSKGSCQKLRKRDKPTKKLSVQCFKQNPRYKKITGFMAVT